MSNRQQPAAREDAAAPPTKRDTRRAPLWPGLLVAALGVAAAWWGNRAVPAVSILTWAVLLGAVATNLRVLPAATTRGLQLSMKKLLRLGIVLLGFSLPLATIAALGVPVIALVVTTLLITLLLTFWLGMRLRLGRPRSLLIATGFAICGASAVAAMQDNAEADEDEVATAIAMVTLCGTVTMVTLPLMQPVVGLDAHHFGIWAGASVHEVGQVVAAASPAGAAAVAIAVVVKLTRVLMLAPVVAGVSLLRRREIARGADAGDRQAPPLVPIFVIGFLVCVGLRSTGLIPEDLLEVIDVVQTVVLAAALFALGTGVHLATLARQGGRPLLLGAVSTLVVVGISLGGVLAVA